MSLHYNPKIGAVLLLGQEDFPDENDLVNLHSYQQEAITIGEWETAWLRFYGEVPEQFDIYLNQGGACRFERLPHQSKPTYKVNFQNYVGQSVLAGFRVTVDNRKITESQFNEMLSFLCEEYASLIFSFRQIAGVNWQQEKAGKDSLYLQLLLIRKHLLQGLPDLDAIAALVHRAMHERFASTLEETPIDRVRDMDNETLLMLFSRTNGWGELPTAHGLCSTPLARKAFAASGRWLFPLQLQTRRRYVTVDTPENRFIKFFLNLLAQRLAEIRFALGDSPGTFLNPNLDHEIAQMERSLDRFLAEPRWREVSEMRQLPKQSTVLQRRAGYSELYRLYSLLQLVSRHNPDLDFAALVEIKDVPLLYEYWCFFQVKRVLDSLFGPPDNASYVGGNNHKGEVFLQEGWHLKYGEITLYYNGSCPGKSCHDMSSYSHNLRPDILLSYRGKKLILDAKYKGFYSNEKTIYAPKDEDIDKMHAYRDAIRNVWGAFVLYPGTDPVKSYRAFAAQTPSLYEGVGVIPLLPNPELAPDEICIALKALISEFISVSTNV